MYYSIIYTTLYIYILAKVVTTGLKLEVILHKTKYT